jgi:hypothetical protein
LKFGCFELAVVSKNLYGGATNVHEERAEGVNQASCGCVFVCEHGDGRPAAELVDYY